MPPLHELEAGAQPGHDPAPPGKGSAVSQFRRVHHNIIMANYNAEAAVTLDDGGSRFVMYDNYFVYGNVGAGGSCHNAQWQYGVGNVYGYVTSSSLVGSEGPSPVGIRTFFYNSTFLNLRDSDWCNVAERTPLNLPQFWNNKVHSPTGKPTGGVCNGGNNSFFVPMPNAEATATAAAVLMPYPQAGTPLT